MIMSSLSSYQDIEFKMEKIIPVDSPEIRFLTKGVAAMEDLGEEESHILKVICFFSYQGHDLSIEQNGVMMVSLTEDLDSIKGSILDYFQHLNTRLSHVTLRLPWLAGPPPPLFHSPSHGNGESCKSSKCRTLTPLNMEGRKELESKNRIKAESIDAVQTERYEAEGPAAIRNHAKSQRQPGTKQKSTGRAQKGANLPSMLDVVPPRLGYPGRE